MFSKTYSMGLYGLDAFCVQVELDLSQGLPRFDLVGLPDTAVKESRERVRAAMKNCGFHFPVSRIVANIAPADIKKEGSLYDLPIFMALLKASEQLSANLDSYVFLGELSLDGEVRAIKGALPMTLEAKEQGFRSIFVPKANELEAGVVEGIQVLPVSSVGEIIAHVKGSILVTPVSPKQFVQDDVFYPLDFADVKGQYEVKRALEIAAAGSHNLIMVGAPGVGKSMLAKRLPSILPEMSFAESIETTKIHSVVGELPSDVSLVRHRPFRSPHHTISAMGMSGGGAIPRPGEVSLAHNGVLFLDELPEFTRQVMEILRQPIEDGIVSIARVAGTLSYPCQMMLVCAMNPCPCGYYGHASKRCTCSDGAAKRYLAKVSGPLLDRIDMHIEMQPLDYNELSNSAQGETSAEIRKRVNAARLIQQVRFAGTGIHSNAHMTPKATREFCILTKEVQDLLELSFEKLDLSARAYDKILRISRTIADLAGSEEIELAHIAEALQYRSLDRKYWRA